MPTLAEATFRSSTAADRIRIGNVPIDRISFSAALDRIAALVGGTAGGAVFTPNVDHVVTAEDDQEFRAAYLAADLCLVDGQPLVWAAALLGARLPEKISGSDLMLPLLQRAAREGWRVYLLGGAEGVAEALSRDLPARLGVSVCGASSRRISLRRSAEDEQVARAIAQSGAQLVLVGLGAPKQELWIHRCRPWLGPAVCVAVGASLDFLAGRVKRAPRWVSKAGLEWLFRLLQEPGRLWRRYLIKDPRFLYVLLRQLAAVRRTGPHA